MLVVNSGEQARLVFQVAVNSDGQQWDGADYFFMNTAGQSFSVSRAFTADDPNFPQHYSMTIESVEEAHAGVYKARAVGEQWGGGGGG